MVRVKICGIKTIEDARVAIEAGADAVGFLVGQGLPSSAKFLAPEAAAEIIQTIPLYIATVMVTTLDDVDAIIKNAQLTGVDTVQFHGNVTPEQIEHVREKLPHLRAYKVIHVYDEDVVEEAKKFEHIVDALEVDTAQKETGYVGGTGKTHDWNISRRVVESVSVPVILAGGLTPDNIAEAIAKVHPYAVDVSSGVTNPDGSKDSGKARLFIERIRQTQSHA